MIEPFTALGAASSIVQFLDFGSRILVEGYTFYKSQDGATKDNLNVEELVWEKMILMERMSKATPARGHAATKDDLAVQKLATRCYWLARELLDLLHELRMDPNTRFKKWESLRKAAQQSRSAGRIRKLRIDLQSTLTLINTVLLNIMQYVLQNDRKNLVVN